jgi:hypothetical protein
MGLAPTDHASLHWTHTYPYKSTGVRALAFFDGKSHTKSNIRTLLTIGRYAKGK